jgi:hypothetical protein
MMEGHLGLVVEGPGDGNSAPELLRRVADYGGFALPQLGRPVIAQGRDNALKPGGLEGLVATAVARPNCGAVLVLLDGEGDAVCELGPALLARAKAVTDKPVIVVLADPLYESWLVASAESMSLEKLSYNGAKSDPEGAIRIALGNRKYAKPVWQPRLTERLEPARVVRRSHSFARFVQRLDGLVGGAA